MLIRLGCDTRKTAAGAGQGVSALDARVGDLSALQGELAEVLRTLASWSCAAAIRD